MFSRVLFLVVCLGISTGLPAKQHRVSNVRTKPPAPKTEILFERNYDKQAIGKRLQNWKPEDKQNIWELSGLYEGDIMLTSPEIENKNGLLSDRLRWPDGIVPFYIEEDDFDKEEISVIFGGIKEYHKKTCLRFRPYGEGDQDYITIQGSNSGCWSMVGRHRLGQILNLQTPNCVRHGVIVHEFMHALGFYHQQSTSDRDDWVKINWENIQRGKENNFNKYDNTTVSDYGVSYDYGSIMHYSSHAFSKNDEPTIEPTMENVKIGQRVGLSEKDITKVQKMYKKHCDSRKLKETKSDYDDNFDLWYLE